MVRECRICGTEFKTYPSRVESGRGKYCSRNCSDQVTLIKKGERLSPETEFKAGEMPHNFKGYRYAKSRPESPKYKLIYKPSHPNATKSGHVREHRLVMEEQIGRHLEDDEIVHHLDGDALNNDIDNLRLMKKKAHDRMNTPLNIHARWQ